MHVIYLCICSSFEDACSNYDYENGKGKSVPLYKHWGSVQAVRPVGGVEV